jgi:peptidoglycan/LPS O-acetylase OafA/YrhL
MSKGARFEALDGLRGIAAVSVVLFHCSYIWFAPAFLSRGYLAVDLFFVLSGFVIAASYETRLADETMTTTQFVKVRFVRLYPLYLVGLGLGLVLPIMSLVVRRAITSDAATLWLSLPSSLLLIPSPFSRTGNFFPLDWPAWSLFFELFINLVYVFTRRFWTIGAMLAAMAPSAAVLLFCNADGGGGGWDWSTFYYGFARVFYAFPAGVLIYRLYVLGVRAPRLPSWLVVILFPLCIQIPGMWGVHLSVLVLFPLIVALGAQADVGRWLRPIWIQAGALSYALYVIHAPAIVLFDGLTKRLRLPLPQAAIGAVFVVLALGVSILLDRYFDVPVRGALTRWLRARPAQTRAASSSAEQQAGEAAG